MNRLRYIDNLRAVAIIGMVLCHMTIYLAPAIDPFNPWDFIGNHLLGDWPAALFLTISGYMLGFKPDTRASHALKRSIFIMAVGFLLSLANSGLKGILECDVLIIIGAFQILSIWTRRLNNKWIVVLIIFVSVAAVFLRHIFGYYDLWGGQRHVISYDSVLLDPETDYSGKYFHNAFRSFALNGYFPVFPWVSFLLIGFLLGRQKEDLDRKRMALLGLICIVFSTALVTYGSYNKINDIVFSFYPLSVSTELFLIAIVLLLFAANRILNGYSEILYTLSRSSLTVYVLQYLIIDVLTYWLGFTLDVQYRLLFGFGVLTVLYFFLRIWSRYDFRFTLEDMMRRICKYKHT